MLDSVRRAYFTFPRNRSTEYSLLYSFTPTVTSNAPQYESYRLLC